ncbi:MAG: hypothetical protein U0T31_01745 [Chitinophagales bacterium]
MLEIEYSILAKRTLTNIALFIEQTNTKGAGSRWKNKFLNKVKKYAKPIQYAPCRHKVYANYGFSCVAIDSWIIIFKVEKNSFYIHQILFAAAYN